MQVDQFAEQSAVILDAIGAGDDQGVLDMILGDVPPETLREILLEGVQRGSLSAVCKLLLSGVSLIETDEPITENVSEQRLREHWFMAVTTLLMTACIRHGKAGWAELVEMANRDLDNMPRILTEQLQIPAAITIGVLQWDGPVSAKLRSDLLFDGDDAAFRAYLLNLLTKIIVLSELPDPGEDGLSARAKRRMSMSTQELVAEYREKEIARRKASRRGQRKKNK